MPKLLTALTAAGLLLAAGAANAAAAAPRHDDLDLGRPQDARTFRMRVNTAADRACEREGGGFNAGAAAFACHGRLVQEMTAALPAAQRDAYEAALQGRSAATAAAPASSTGGEAAH